MNKTLLASLNQADRLLVAETEPAALAGLDEDAVAALHARVLRARNKAIGVYRWWSGETAWPPREWRQQLEGVAA